MRRDLPTDHSAVMSRMKEWGIQGSTFFDIGAAKGGFAAMLRNVWPQSRLVCFEAALSVKQGVPFSCGLVDNEAARFRARIQVDDALFSPQSRARLGEPFRVSTPRRKQRLVA